MNVIAKALSDIRANIQIELLEDAFAPKLPDQWKQKYMLNLDEEILNKVIHARVIPDMDIIGGTEATIPLGGINFDYTDAFYNETRQASFRVPMALTQGRRIISLDHLGFFNQMSAVGAMAATSGYGGYPSNGVSGDNNALMNVASAIVGAHDVTQMVSSSRMQLLGNNVVWVKENITLTSNCYLRCHLSNDKALANIQVKYQAIVSKAILLAVQAYIWTQLSFKVGNTKIQGGADFSIYKDELNEFKTANKDYEEYKKDVMASAMFMNDTEAWTRHIRKHVGNN